MSLAALLLACLPTQAAMPPDTLAQRLKVCTACHGAQGQASANGYVPRIAGKPAGYLYNQLVNFRDARRHFPAMAYLLKNQSDDYLREMAGYFAGEHPAYAAIQTVGMAADIERRGRELASRGDSGRRIPACMACHGKALMGSLPAVPGLLGLPKDYLLAQFGNWKHGLRRAAAPDCMAGIAERMSPQDIVAVTTWLSAQAVAPLSALPVLRPDDLPLACGSIPR